MDKINDAVVFVYFICVTAQSFSSYLQPDWYHKQNRSSASTNTNNFRLWNIL